MTVSANPTPDFKRDELLDAAIRVTGILSDDEVPTASQLRLAATHLNLTLETLQSEGVILTTIERKTMPLVAGTKEYTLASDIIDIELGQDDTVGTIRDNTSSTETQVKIMSRGEYLQLAVKDTVISRPSRCYVERQAASVHLVFWPIPDASMVSFQYTSVRLLRAGDTGAVTMDLARTWSQYLVFAVAAAVALSNSLFDRGQYLQQRADELLEKCKAGDSQHGTMQLRVGHIGRNW